MSVGEELEIDVDNEEGEAFVEYDLQIYPSDYTLKVIKDMWEEGEIEIPDFQRNFVWTIKQSSLLIESFLLGLPVPQLFFYIDDEHNNLVIDGQQRITSVVDFFEGYFGPENKQGRRQVFRLTGLDDDSPFAKKRYIDLEEKDQRKLRNTVLRVVNIRQVAPSNDTTSMYHIFERLNTGGTPLKPQEIRNCVFAGPIVEELRALNENPSWRKILGRDRPEKHQRDVEILLRVFAMYGYSDQYEKPMKEFLNVAMRENRKGQTRLWKSFKQRFPSACEAIVQELGEKPFHIRGPINLAALDSVLSVVCKLGDKRKRNLAEAVNALLEEEEYKSAVFFNTSDTSVVTARLRMAEKYLR